MFMLMLLSISPLLMMSTKKWVIIWLMSELSLVSFIFLLNLEKKKQKNFMFFIFQTISSMMMMMFVFFSKNLNFNSEINFLMMMMIMSIMMKIAMFPFHSWLVFISKNISWLNLFTLLTWQKIAPIVMMSKICIKMSINFILIMSMTAVSILLLKMNKMKNMIVCSSIAQNSWMFISMKFMKTISIVFMMVYSLILFSIMFTMKKNNSKFLLSNMNSKNMNMDLMVATFSLAGIPPSINFFVKVLIINFMIKINLTSWLIFIMLMMTCVSFFIYFKMTMKFLKMVKEMNKKKFYLKSENKKFNLSSLMLVILMMT